MCMSTFPELSYVMVTDKDCSWINTFNPTWQEMEILYIDGNIIYTWILDIIYNSNNLSGNYKL